MSYQITVDIPDDVAERLLTEASSRRMTLDELVLERLAGLMASVPPERPNYSEILKRAQEAVITPRS